MDAVGGLNHIMKDCAKTQAEFKCVVSMMDFGMKSTALNNAVERAVKAGIVVISAAGSYGKDACDTSPASQRNAITVGSIDKSDKISNLSNRGHVSIFMHPDRKLKLLIISIPRISKSIV